MKKSLLFFGFVFFFIIGAFLLLGKSVQAQDIPCECIHHSGLGLDRCDPRGLTDPCGPAWKCQCPPPVDGICSQGTCVPLQLGNCQPGESSFFLDNPDFCKAPCHPSDNPFECCCPETPNSPDDNAFFRPGECDLSGPGNPDNIPGIQTSLGCIPTTPQLFVAWVLKYAIAIGAGIAFLLMIWGVFQITTSAGNPDKLNEGKEIMTSAGAGLLFIIFAVFILELIGVKILRIPGWG